MKIGELAEAAATPIETIRYYERAGLLPAPARSAGNFRLYGTVEAERLSFIRHCRVLDMNLDEIRVLLRFEDAPGENCGEVNTLLDEHIGHVTARVRELRKLSKELRTLRDLCRVAQDAGHCGILNELSMSNAARATVPRPASHLASHLASRLTQVHGVPARQRAHTAKQGVRQAR